MALFKKYSLNKKCLMEDWEATEDIRPMVNKILNGDAESIAKEDIYGLLGKILVKKTLFGKVTPLTATEVEKISYLDAHKHCAAFFFIYMKKRTFIEKLWTNSASKLAKPIPKLKFSKVS